MTKVRDKKALKRQSDPALIVTDGLKSHKAASQNLGAADKQEIRRHANNVVENSPLPLRRWERAMLGFRRMRLLQKFASVHASVHNHFSAERHIVHRQTYKLSRSESLAAWHQLAS